MSLAYDQYLAEHIGNVNRGLNWMLDNLALSQEEKNALETAMVEFNHDESKYSTEEYDAYDQYFYGQNKSDTVKQAFNYAWLHHIHHNPHHWQYWVLFEDDPEGIAPFNGLRIPLNYIFEMIADWWAFSWKEGNLFEIFNWYADHRGKQIINPESRLILERILKKILDVLIMQETVRGRDISEIEKQYKRFWMEQEDDLLKWDHPSAQVIGKVVDTRETENGLEVTVEHSGIKGQKWGVRNGPPYPLGDKEKLDSIKNLNDLMNNGWDYGVLDHGKHLLDTDNYDWDKKYRTTPVDILEKEKIGTCWDFVNYQHDKLKNMGIKDSSYLITIQKSEKPDDIVTHTFTTFELGDKQYWLESAAWPKRGVHEINGIEDVARELNEMYHNPGLGLSVFKYNPEGMDKGLTSNEFFDKASQNLVYDEEPIRHSGIKGQKWGIRNGPPYPLESAKVAEKLYSDAEKKSKKITKDVENAAKRAGGEIHGLENQLKTKESIERKLNKKVNEKGMDITEAANSIKDAVRYTVIAPTDKFVNMYYDFKADMANKGYSETSCDNYFDKFSKGEVKHKAIQSNFADKDGYEFEVQFHTPESQDAKDKKLPLYNERRQTGISESRAKELEKQMEDLAVNIPDPEGVRDILSHGEQDSDEDLYGVPELKKFPMPDKKHVKSAIRFFNYVDPKYEKELAEAILEKAEEFGLDLKSDISVGNENRFQKYLPKKEDSDD